MHGVGPEAFAAVIAAYTVGARVVGVRPGTTDHQRAALRPPGPERDVGGIGDEIDIRYRESPSLVFAVE
ncbi:hypothetical protein [Streptomyces anthocyanicus]|uniref:hypothetical protein n=1 Tax=Streptomyces anthocyanicus TaxID=68174 RepID=UPI00178556DB|nr:hypothetical protein [Streptomyces anthocyanicus]WSB59904.1 hypothetical protein OIE72_06585 [Streptomyces anthocyanicus]WTC47641.1 hypothetical protein OG855_07805 [Streptomyces anthocyanicus]GHA76329.1 hypothetical protein GCM10010391_72100 [Streptomyces anthocyanicus]